MEEISVDDEPQRFLDATVHTVSWFWKRLNDGELDMKPPFQRNPVWQEHQKSYFLDTILRGYPAPEVYLQTAVSSIGDETHTVIDGQQRIRAALEFVDNRFPLGDQSGELVGYFFDDLNPVLRTRVFAYKFVTRTLPSLPEDQTRDIFARLNRNNVALNRQELRHATYWGGFISSMEEISQNEFWVSSGLFTANDFRRMQDIEYVSELAVAVLYGIQNKKARLDYYYGAFESEFPDRGKAEEVFRVVLGELSKIIEWPTKARWSRKVDFYTLFHVMADQYTLMPFSEGGRYQLASKLAAFSDEVSRLLRLDEEERADATRLRAAYTYARGVRNSSDAGSRRMRYSGLSAFLADGEVEIFEQTVLEVGPLDHLPSSESLMAEAESNEGDNEDEND